MDINNLPFIVGTLFGSLLNAFLFFFILNLLLKKLSLKTRALLTFFIVIIIKFFLSKFEGSDFLIIDEFIFNGISIVIAYFCFKEREAKKMKTSN